MSQTLQAGDVVEHKVPSKTSDPSPTMTIHAFSSVMDVFICQWWKNGDFHQAKFHKDELIKKG